MSRMRITVVLLLMVSSQPALALPQSSVSMSAVEVDLWPEYDRPDMLVIYKITLAPEVLLPAAINIRIPAAAGRPNAVAEKQLDGRLTSVIYDQRQDAEWTSLIFTASRPELQVEYYDPRIERDAANRSFIYTWPADYPAGALSVQVQQPQGATDLRMNPPAEHTSPAGEGFIYHILHLQARGAGEPVEVSIEYEKQSDTLSVSTLPQAVPDQPEMSPVTTLPSQGGSAIPPWLFVVLAVVVVAAGGGLWWRLGRSGKTVRTVSTPAKGGGTTFCTQCGAPTHPGDRFCHACGTHIPGN